MGLPRLFVTLTALLSAPLAQAPVPADWKSFVDGKAAGFSGLVLIGRGETVELLRAYGLADPDTGRRNAADTRFNLGSINKTFTAIAVAQLIQQGRLSLDDAVAKHLLDYPDPAAAARISVHQLLTHRSGMASFMGADFGDATTVAEMTRFVGRQPLAFEPGERQAYSNGGYVVLGRIVEVVSGRDYATYVAEQIYAPAGMTRAGFARPGDADPSLALGLRPPRPGNPAGGGYASADDLFRFSRALRGGRLLDPRMTDSVLHGTFSGETRPKFGFALREQGAGARRFIGNGGGAPGVNAEFRFEPAGEYTVVVLANSSPPAATQLLNAILERLAVTKP